MKIRHAKTEDQSQLVQCILNMALESENKQLEINTVRQGIQAVFDKPERGQYWVIADNEAEKNTAQLIGSLLITTEWSDWNNSPYWWIQNVYLAPEHRGKGLINQLFQTIETEARKEAVTEIRLYVDENNTRAIRSYLKSGFKKDHYELMINTLN